MIKNLKIALENLTASLTPLDVSDFIRPPAEYVALYTAICIPPMASRPGHGNLPKPFFAITYGECKVLHSKIADIHKTLAQKTRGGETARLLAEQVQGLLDQLQEMKIYGEYICTNPKNQDEDKAYHLTTFINDFTNSSPRQKSRHPEFSGTRRHALSVGQMKAIVGAIRQIEATIHENNAFPLEAIAEVVELQPAV